jgi:hypothetical protein
LANRRHGLSLTPEHRTWRNIHQRCYNQRDDHFEAYGGAGVRVHPRWHVFENFLADMGPRPSSAHSIDRYPDKTGDYAPGNCRWATVEEQNNNLRTNVVLEFRDRRLTVAQWARATGIGVSALRHRLRAGLPLEQVLTTPSRRPR